MPGLIRITPPATEPVTLAETKAHLRVEHNADDTLITNLITAARESAEDYTARAFITQSWRLWLNGLPSRTGHDEWFDGVRELPVDIYGGRTITLRRAPLLTVTTLSTYNTVDVESVMSPTAYTVDNARVPGKITLVDGASLPSDRRRVNGIKVDFTCGYGPATTDVPAALRHGILHHVASLYERRGDESLALPLASLTFYQPYRLAQVA